MINPLKAILQPNKDNVKSHLTSSPFPSYRLVMRKGRMKQIMTLKGWNTYEAAAKALGFTRAYIQMIDKTRVQVGSEFITRLAACLGSIHENWHVHFEIIPWGVVDENHPKWNQAKHDGEVPYQQYSPSANLRKDEYSVEEKNS